MAVIDLNKIGIQNNILQIYIIIQSIIHGCQT